MRPAATIAQLLGLVVRHHRVTKAAKQTELATVLRITGGAFSRLERGHASFSVPQLALIAEALGVQVSRLWVEAERAAAVLTGDGVVVLKERPQEQLHQQWLWLADTVLEGAVARAVAEGHQHDEPVMQTVRKSDQGVRVHLGQGKYSRKFGKLD